MADWKTEKVSRISLYSICKQVLQYANRVVLQKKILIEFHIGHPVMTRIKSLRGSYT